MSVSPPAQCSQTWIRTTIEWLKTISPTVRRFANLKEPSQRMRSRTSALRIQNANATVTPSTGNPLLKNPFGLPWE